MTAAAASVESGGHRGFIMLSVMMATTLVILDQTIASIALPHMQGGLSASRDQIGWVMTTYFMTQAVSMASTGWLVNRFGRKRTFIIALSGFGVCALLSSNAASLSEILLWRGIQGAFSAPVIPISQSLILDSYPRERHGQALALWGLGVIFAPVMGPVVGGWLTDSYGWRWVFLVGAPFAAVALVTAVVFIRESPLDRERRFDWMGFIAIGLVLVSLQLVLDRGELKGWFDSTEIVIEVAIVVLGLYMVVVHILTTDHPFVSPAIFADRNMALGLVFMFLLGCSVLSLNVILPMFMQNLRGFPVLTAGLIMAPRGIGSSVSLILAGYLVRWIDGRILIAVGFACVAFSSWQFSTFTPDVSIEDFIIATVFNGLGIGFIWVPLTTFAFATLDTRYRTEASTLTSLMRNYGSGVGISVVIAVLSRTSAVAHSELIEFVSPFNERMSASNLPLAWSLDTAAGRAGLELMVSRQAEAIGFANDFTLVAIMAAASIPLVLLLSRGRSART
jgi:MFS transporter, DHA2 family, multidrug resistance protein